MYKSYYGLKKEPFHVTPDPEFLFLSSSHKEAIGSVIYGVERRKGFVAIKGEVGLGKTTVLRSYLGKANKNQMKIIYLFNANVSFKDLLKTIYRELDIKPEAESEFEMVAQLHYVLIEEYKQGRNVVLIVDEAQNMPVETLENLRMLSNLETTKDKLLQILLIGQPELDNLLNLHKLRQLKQRIVIRATIHPLTQQESIHYMKHRLSRAGATDPASVFTPGAMDLIARHSGGIPRVINILSNLALVNGFAYEKKPIDTAIVKEVIADHEGTVKPRPAPRWRFAYPAALLLLLLLAALFWLSPLDDLLLAKIRDGALSTTTSATVPSGTSDSGGSHSFEGQTDHLADGNRSGSTVVRKTLRPNLPSATGEVEVGPQPK